MKATSIKIGFLKSGGIHMRPAAQVVKVASLFKDFSVRLCRESSTEAPEVNLKTIMAVAMAQIRSGEDCVLEVEASNEKSCHLEELVCLVMGEVLENVIVSADGNLDDSRSATPSDRAEDRNIQMGRIRTIFSKSMTARDDYPDLEHDVLEGCGLIESQHIAQKEVVLNSKKGFHLLTANMIAIVGRRFQSTIDLIYEGEQGPEIRDATQPLEVVQIHLNDGARIRLRARGSDSSMAVSCLGGMIEHFGDIEREISRRGRQLSERGEMEQFAKALIERYRT